MSNDDRPRLLGENQEICSACRAVLDEWVMDGIYPLCVDADACCKRFFADPAGVVLGGDNESGGGER